MDDDTSASIQLGAFDLDGIVGSGGMGEVWRGRHRASHLPVAVKLLTATEALEPAAQTAFSNEVRSIARLDHARIAQVYDFDRVTEAAAHASSGRLIAGSPYFVMELLDAGALDPFRFTRPWSDLKQVLLALLSALGHAHARGVVHRDLKPGNILFAGQASAIPGLRLTDFGIAHALGSGDEEEISWGTPHYMSPEQHLGESRDFGPWTDLYALGCIAYELACGERPFPAETMYEAVWGHMNHEVPPMKLRVDVPDGFPAWVGRLLEKRPQDRFERAADAAFALNSLEDGKVWGLPPLPFDWRSGAEVEQHPLGYVGGGLGLFGLRSLPLLGRDAELSSIWKVLSEVWSRASPRVVVLHGPAGHGKSRLVRSLCERAEELGCATSMRVRHEIDPGPDTGLRGALRSVMGCGGLSGTALRERLEVLLREDGARDVLLETERRALYLESAEERPEDLELIAATLSRWSRQRPLILWLDEPHWSDVSLSFLEYILQEDASVVGPVLVVASFRDETLNRRPEAQERIRRLLEGSSGSAVSVQVDALNDQQCQRLARDVLSLDAELADAVVERADGSPMFIVQLVRTWVQQGLLQPSADGFSMRDDVEPEIPSDLLDVWLRRVQFLCEEFGADAVPSLEAAAALGGAVDALEWNHLCSLAGLEARPDLLAALLKGGLARPTESGWEFVHERLRQSLERSGLRARRWAGFHSACLTMLQQRYNEGMPGLKARLERHADEVAAFDEQRAEAEETSGV